MMASCLDHAIDAPAWLRGVRNRAHDDRSHKPKDRANKDRKRRKRRKRSGQCDPRSVRAALQGMLLGYDRLVAVLDGEALRLARSAFREGGDFPGDARVVLGWPEPQDIPVDPTTTPPWEC